MAFPPLPTGRNPPAFGPPPRPSSFWELRGCSQHQLGHVSLHLAQHLFPGPAPVGWARAAAVRASWSAFSGSRHIPSAPLLGLLNKFCGFGLSVRQLLFVFGAESFCFPVLLFCVLQIVFTSAVRLSIILVMGPKRKCFRSRNRTRILTIFQIIDQSKFSKPMRLPFFQGDSCNASALFDEQDNHDADDQAVDGGSFGQGTADEEGTLDFVCRFRLACDGVRGLCRGKADADPLRRYPSIPRWRLQLQYS